MRAPLVTLLAAVLCVQQAYPFMCYICQEQESNKDCLTISMCSKEDRYCVTVRKDVRTKEFLALEFLDAKAPGFKVFDAVEVKGLNLKGFTWFLE
ncbi:hypothetical protein BTVI_31807 [Pitangus sulphuratus]|nr:hypothetical protein BTVI_31807 [Pitangus sulphuratus]